MKNKTEDILTAHYADLTDKEVIFFPSASSATFAIASLRPAGCLRQAVSLCSAAVKNFITLMKTPVSLSHQRTHGAQRNFPALALRSLAGTLLCALAILAPFSAQAATYSWGVSSGTWNDAANWGGTAPTASDIAIINNSGTAQLPTAVSGSYSELYLGSNSGVGTINLTGGTLTGGSAVLGQASSVLGTVNVSSGTWTNTNNLTVGEGAGGTGALTISGGNVSQTNAFVGNDQFSNGTVNVSGGTLVSTERLWIGLSGTGSLAISGGQVNSDSSSIGFGALGTGFVTISGGTFSVTNNLLIGNSGTGSLAISGNGYLENSAGLIGLSPNARGTVTVTSGSWANSSGVYVGYEGSGNSLSITGGGTVTSSQGWLGFGDSSNTNLGNNNTATVSGTGSIWNNSSNQYVGQYGSGNALSIDSGGAVASTGNGYIGLGSMSNVNSGNDNTVTVTGAGSTWSNALSFVVGDQGSGNALVIENGGSVSNASSWIGSGNSVFAANGNNNAVTVSGTGSNWTNSGNLVVGKYGSGNTLTIEDGALVTVGGTLSFSELGSSQQNFLRLDGGYIALFGEQAAYVGTLITAGHIQLWNGSTWVTATGGDLNIVQYQGSPAGEAAAEAATGYSGLGGYTVVTPQVVPEPGTAALIALGLGALLFRRRPRVYPKNVVDGWKGRKGRA